MRFFLYARYSSDLQSPRSVDDQLALGRSCVATLGGTVAGVFADHAISGALLINRPGIQDLMAACRAGGADAVWSEALDRISRGQADTATFYDDMTHLGVKIVTQAEGEINELHVGFKGTMNAVFLKDLRAKIKRGQSGRAVEGLAVAGLAYGYSVKSGGLDAKGEPLRGLREIDPEKAAIVARIFRDFVAGMSTREIAAALNREGVKGPSGKAWAQNSIAGSRKRASGILHNEIYIGRQTYNRQSFSKDPRTGRRRAKLNPQAEWIVADVPELRIIDDATWAAAQRVLAQRGRPSGKPGGNVRRPNSLLSGLLFCARCGSPYVTRAAGRLACKANRYNGTCDNGISIRTAELESRVLDGLRERLAAPDAVAAAIEEYRQELKRLRAEAQSRRGRVADELRDLSAKIERAVAAVLDGMDSPAVRAKLAEMEARKAELEADVALAASADEVVELHPRIAGIYRDRVAEMLDRLNGDDRARQEAVGYVRSLVDRITLHPPKEGRRMDIELKGQLAAVLGSIPPQEHKANFGSTAGVSVGSGGGI